MLKKTIKSIGRLGFKEMKTLHGNVNFIRKKAVKYQNRGIVLHSLSSHEFIKINYIYKKKLIKDKSYQYKLLI